MRSKEEIKNERMKDIERNYKGKQLIDKLSEELGQEFNNELFCGNNKYYVPSIEDIRVGYECETFITDRWATEIVNPYNISLHVQNILNAQSTQHNTSIGFARAPYLTKEQIESEGWELMITEDWVKVSVFNKNDFQYELLFDELKHTITVIKFRKKESSILFSGECLSINEFRMITRKSLKIE